MGAGWMESPYWIAAGWTMLHFLWVGCGIGLLAVEILVLPGFGIAGVLGITCIITGLFGMLVKNPPDRFPWPQSQIDWELFTSGVWGLFFGLFGFGVLAWLVSKYMPRVEFLSGLILLPAAAKQGDEMEVNITAPPESKSTRVNVGDVGVVVSTLRPTGKVKFDDAIVDVVATAEFLDKDTEVEIIEIRGNRVLVRKHIEK